MHSDMWHSLYFKDKKLWLKILKMYPDKNELYINDWEKELKEEGEL